MDNAHPILILAEAKQRISSPSSCPYPAKVSRLALLLVLVAACNFLILRRFQDDTNLQHQVAVVSGLSRSSSGSCDRVLLYASDLIAKTGLGHQIAFHVLASVLAIFTDSALVILDPPQGSSLGCPRLIMAKNKKNGGSTGDYEEDNDDECGDLPTGLMRIIQNPQWLSRGCTVPCTHTHSYEDWIRIAEQTNRQSEFAWTVCSASDNDEQESGRQNNNNVTVLAIGKFHMKVFWGLHLRPKLWIGESESSKNNGEEHQRKQWEQWVTKWSTRMGASNDEIHDFLSHTNRASGRIMDYLRALITRAGVQFQPWVVEDVKTRLLQIDKLSFSDRSTSLRLLDNTSFSHSLGYDAMHIRRGDRIYEDESMKAVENYWVERGYPPINVTIMNAREKKIKLISASYPANYIPFAQYYHQYKSSKCLNTSSSSNDLSQQRAIRHVYLATDDIENIRAEIANLTSSEGAEYWIHCDEQIEFVFNPQEQYAKHIHVSKQTISPPRNNETYGEEYEKYLRTISAITDLHILSQSDIFVGEMRSFWGRLLLTFRTSFQQHIPVTKDTMIAWGAKGTLLPPPW